MNWTVRSYDPNSGESFNTLSYGDNADAARRQYLAAEAHARVHGGGVQLKCDGRTVAAYQGSAEND